LACSATTPWTVAWSDQGASGPWTVAGQVVSKRDDQCDDLADAIDRLRAVGWSVGDTAFHDVERGGLVWVVTGSNGENRIRAKGATCAETWRRVLDQAAAVEMCRVGLGQRGSKGASGVPGASLAKKGPGAVLSRVNGGVLPVGWVRKPWPRAGRNRSGMICTPRVRAPDLEAVPRGLREHGEQGNLSGH
jgi:hypothetical protein